MWLTVFEQHGVTRTLGLDTGHVDPASLVTDPARFLACDLTDPPALDRRFDLALCLEVAEHLPPASAEGLVAFLTGLSDVVLFSAAVPGQGGQRHLNEQWPGYWQDKFGARGFRCHDTLRYRLWERDAVEWWYRQNLLLFLREGVAADLPGTRPLALVHPGLFEHTHARYCDRLRRKGGVRGVARELRAMLGRCVPGRGAGPRDG
jgi:hypothetical protein